MGVCNMKLPKKMKVMEYETLANHHGTLLICL